MSIDADRDAIAQRLIDEASTVMYPRRLAEFTKLVTRLRGPDQYRLPLERQRSLGPLPRITA